MKNLRYIYGLAFLMMAACSENDPEDSAIRGNIHLGATVGELLINRRVTAAPYLPQKGEPLNAAVWFRNENGGYEHAPVLPTYLPVHTTVTFDSLQMTHVKYNEEYYLKYPTDHDVNVYCVGMSPQSGWSTTDNIVVTHAINGSEDLMFAKEIRGSWKQRFPTQEYKHLLTWIRITICASSPEAIDAWGTIPQITVNRDSEVSVNLETEEYTYGGEQQPIETMSKDVTLTTAIQQVGDVFCSPETAYTVTVRYIKNGKVITKTVSLPLNIIHVDKNDKVESVTHESQAIGRCFVFSLYFTPNDVIEGECMLNSWSNQNEDVLLKN